MERVYKYDKIKVNSSSGRSKTIYYNGSYLFLFEKGILQSFEISCE